MTYGLLIAKLHALNFEMNELNLIFDYLTGRKHRVKISFSFSSYLDIFHSVPQASILGPLLFNLFLCDLLLFVDEADILSYADDNTPYVSWKYWRHSRKIRRSRKSIFWMVFKQFLKGKYWQMSSHFKYGWTLLN